MGLLPTGPPLVTPHCPSVPMGLPRTLVDHTGGLLPCSPPSTGMVDSRADRLGLRWGDDLVDGACRGAASAERSPRVVPPARVVAVDVVDGDSWADCPRDVCLPLGLRVGDVSRF